MSQVNNATIATLRDHRSIRAFRDEPVAEDMLEALFQVAIQTATSSFFQQRTIIRVKDPAIRQALAAASGQPYVGGDRGELLVFVVDLYRNAKLREEAGADANLLESTSLFLQGVEDTMIAAQSVVVAAESLGLGTVYLGSITRDPKRVIEALELPLRTFPIVAVLVGHPAQEPALKPRLPRDVAIAVDTYPKIDDFHHALGDYDQIIQSYYDLRNTTKPVGTFTSQIETKLNADVAQKDLVREALTAQRLALY
jgi:FMN reductase (NADPH)